MAGRPEVASDAAAILSLRTQGQCFSALEQHYELACLLGLPLSTVGLDSSGTSPSPEELDDDEIIEVP